MGVEGLAKCMKITLIVFNLLFVILGVVCLGLGIWILIDKDKLLELVKITSDTYDGSLLQNGAYVLIGGGAFIFLIGIFGCIGACKESRVLLGLYGGLVLMVFVLQLVAGILAAVFQKSIESKLQNYLNGALKSDYVGTWDTKSAFSLALDFVQLEYDCCGIADQNDFNDAAKWKKSTAQQIPFTCCMFTDKSAYPDNPNSLTPKDKTCLIAPDATNANINKGCYDTIRGLLENNAKIIIGVGVGVALIELFGVIFAFYVCCKLREQNKVY